MHYKHRVSGTGFRQLKIKLKTLRQAQGAQEPHSPLSPSPSLFVFFNHSSARILTGPTSPDLYKGASFL